MRKEVDPRYVTLCDDEFLDKFNLKFEKFTPTEVDAIKEVLLKHKSLFAINDHQLGCLKYVEYYMELHYTSPVKQRYCPIHPNLRDRVQK